MGTIAARDCVRVLELTEQVAAALLFAVVQGVEMRDDECLGDELQQTIAEFRQHFAFLENDRALDKELRHCVDLIRQRHWSVYD